MTHAIVAADPRYRAWQERGARFRDQRTSLAAHITAAHAQARTAQTDHEHAVADALSKGKEIPPAPPPQDLLHLDRAEAVLRRAEERHREERREVLAEMADDPEVWRALQDRHRTRLQVVKEAAPLLRAAVADVEETTNLARDLWNAQDATRDVVVRPTRAEKVRKQWTVDDLMDAQAGDLLRPQGVIRGTEPPDGVVVADPEPGQSAGEINAAEVKRASAENRQLGLATQGASGFGTQRWPSGGLPGSARDRL